MEFFIFSNFELLVSNITILFFKFILTNTISRRFPGLKCGNSFPISSQKYHNKTFSVQNLKLVVYIWKFPFFSNLRVLISNVTIFFLNSISKVLVLNFLFLFFCVILSILANSRVLISNNMIDFPY